ncbi:MAG: hypothetical protein KY453_03430, partial [Gemmatimonadetes bacterium]|nr:hypothetical protein [Gemmatimonadota bacterium]
CTGYTKIYVAVEKAAERIGAGEWGWRREGLGPLPEALGALPGAEAMPHQSPAEDERPPEEQERVAEGSEP